jgi:hypothetical protein
MSRPNSRPASRSLPGAGLSHRPRVLNSPRSVIAAGNKPLTIASDPNRKLLPTPDGGGASRFGVVPVRFLGREPLQHFFEGNMAFEAGEGSAQTEVNAVAEGDVVADVL